VARAGRRVARAGRRVARAGRPPGAPARHQAGSPAAAPRGCCDHHPGGGPPQRAHPDRRSGHLSVCRPRTARIMRLPAGRGPVHLFAGGVSRPSVGQLAARHTRLVAGRGPMHPIAGAVYAQHGGQRAAADSESGARAGPRFTVTLSTAAGGPQRTPSRAPGPGPRLHCQPADGPRGQPQPPRPGPGPRPGRDSDSQPARADRQSVGPPAARPRAAGAVSLDGGGRQSGRCGVLTRIRVGAAAVAGPGRNPGPPALRATTSPDKV